MEAVFHILQGFSGVPLWLGLVSGILIGLTGMGGGALLTPALILLLHKDPVVAVGTGLVIAAVTKLFGSASHVRLGNVDTALVKTMLAGSIPGAVVGFGLLWSLNHTQIASANSVVKTVIGGTLVLAALSLWTRPLWERGVQHAERNPKMVNLSTIGVAFVVGALVSLTSVGTGTLLVPFLIFFCQLAPSRVVGTDIVHGFALTAVVAALYSFGGHVDWALAGAVVAGAVPGVVFGSHLSLLVSRPAMDKILGSVLLVSSVKFF